MDEYVKQSIEARKQAMSATYKVGAAMQKKIDKLFGETQEYVPKEEYDKVVAAYEYCNLHGLWKTDL